MSTFHIIGSLVIGLGFLFFLILRTKTHPYVALVTIAVLLGLMLQMPTDQVVKAIQDGFGGTLGNIGIIIGFGVIMGEIFDVSGAAKRMALTFLKFLGFKNEDIAFLLTGFLVSIPLFCDSAFVVLSPVAKAISQITKKSFVSLGITLALGLVVTHTLVPPTPGPLVVAGLFGVSLGDFILWSIVVAIPCAFVPLIYIRLYLGKHMHVSVEDSGELVRHKTPPPTIDSKSFKIDESNLPSTFSSFAPILLPIVLILLSAFNKFIPMSDSIRQWVIFFGTPIIAVGIAVFLAVATLTKNISTKEAIVKMDHGLSSAATIIFVTGGGAALGGVLRASGAGNSVAQLILEIGLPPILLPIIISTLIRFIQGSGTVALVTTATLTAPILVNLNVNPIFAALAACVGGLFFGYFNDSYFWIVTRTIGLTETKDQIKAWSFTSTISWCTGVVVILLLNAFIK